MSSSKLMSRVLSSVLALSVCASSLVYASAAPADEESQAGGKGATVPFITYEAEDQETTGTVNPLGEGLGKISDVASQQAFVRLNETGQSITFQNAEAANRVVLRYSLPQDFPDSTLSIYVNGEDKGDFSLSSKQCYGEGNATNRRFDETFLAVDIPADATVTIQKDADNTAEYYDIDLIDVEKAADALTKPEGYFDITDYGAIADDNQDDTDAIQKALDAAAASQDVKGVYIPEGTFQQTKTLRIPEGVALQGAGMWYSCIQLTGGNGEWNGFYSLVKDNTISNLRFTEPNANPSSGSQLFRPIGENLTMEEVWVQNIDCICRDIDKQETFESGSNMTIQNCRFRGLFRLGIQFGNQLIHDSVVKNCHFRGMGGDALSTRTEARYPETVKNVSFLNNTVVATYRDHGFSVMGGESVTIQGNVLDGVPMAGMYLSTERFNPDDPTPGSKPIEKLDISNNTITRTGYQDHGGINVWLASNNWGDNRIVGNLITNNKHEGIRISATEYGDTGVTHRTIIKDNVLTGNGSAYSDPSEKIDPILVNNIGYITDAETILATVEAARNMQNEGYSEEAWQALQDAIAAAEEVVAKADEGTVSQDEIDEANAALLEAMETVGYDVNRRGAVVPFTTYEAEAAVLGGAAEKDKDVGYELGTAPGDKTIRNGASGKSYVWLGNTGDSVEFQNVTAANRIVLRYSVPKESPDSTLSIYVNGEDKGNFTLTSTQCYDQDNNGVRAFDEKFLAIDIPQGASVRIQKDADDTAEWYGVDLIDVETAPEALTMPAGYISIEDYGATANDETDDLAAIQAAMDAAGEKGCGVWIPEGTFLQSHRVNVPANVDIKGAGMWYSEIQFTEHGTTYSDDIGFELVSNTTISDIRFMGCGISRSNSAHLIREVGEYETIENCWIQNVGCVYGWCDYNNVMFRNNRVRGTFFDGIHFGDGEVYNSSVINCHFRGVGDDAIAQVNREDMGLAHDNLAAYNTISASYWGRGISCVGGDNFTITNNNIDSVYMAGIIITTETLSPSQSRPIQNLLIKDNIINNCGHTGHNHAGIQTWLFANWMKDVVIENNVVSNGPTEGIHFDFTDYGDSRGRTVIRNNTVVNNAVCNYKVDVGPNGEENFIQPILENNIGIFDDTAFLAAVDAAKAIENDNYTEASWNALQAALKDAQALIEKGDYVTQEELDAAATALNNAIDALVQGADYTALNDAIAKAKALNADDYKDFSAVEDALAAAEAIDKNLTIDDQQVIDDAVKALNDAIDALQEKEPVEPTDPTDPDPTDPTDPDPTDPTDPDPKDPTDPDSTDPGDKPDTEPDDKPTNGPATGESFPIAFVVMLSAISFCGVLLLKKKDLTK